MITQNEMQELLSYNANEHEQIVSVYLNSDSGEEPVETIKQRVRGMMKEASVNGESGKMVEQYLNHSYDWSQPGLALFAATDGDFFRAFPTAVSFRNRVRKGNKPHIKPLAHLLDHYAHYGVILIDRVGARFYNFHLGELQESEGFLGEDVRSIKSGGGSGTVGMRGGKSGARRESEVIDRNLREAAGAAADFFDGTLIRRLFVGGTSKTVAKFSDMLPKQLQSCVAGTFSINANATVSQVQEQALALLLEANEQREGEMVASMITAAAKKGNGVAGLDDTLQAISDNRVQTLLVSDGFRTHGYVQADSGFVVANLMRSPLTEDELEAVDDVVETAVSRTLLQGGHVEIISDHPDLDAVGKIGAILRY